jgi:cobyrinic acid a,c-diamide synthase
MPWPATAGDRGGDMLRGHEFHHSSLENLEPGQRFAYRVRRGHGIDGSHDGLVLHNLVASYSHLRGGAGSSWPERFVAFARRWRERSKVRAAPPVAALLD